MKFKGFTASETFTRIPDSFFERILDQITDLDELRVTLTVLRMADKAEDPQFFLRIGDIAAPGSDPSAGLEKAAARGTLIRVEQNGERIYFLNSPRGKAAAEACHQGTWKPGASTAHLPPERPNIFKLYEENIGPLTPLVADLLKEAEETYPPEQIAEAVGIAVRNNKRNWNYVEAILRRWKEEGHAKKQDQRNAEPLRGEAVRRKVEDFFDN